MIAEFKPVKFESSVNSEYSKTMVKYSHSFQSFESSVNSEYSKTLREIRKTHL